MRYVGWPANVPERANEGLHRPDDTVFQSVPTEALTRYRDVSPQRTNFEPCPSVRSRPAPSPSINDSKIGTVFTMLPLRNA